MRNLKCNKTQFQSLQTKTYYFDISKIYINKKNCERTLKNLEGICMDLNESLKLNLKQNLL